MANTKRRLAKTKTPPKAVNLGACLRFYAPNEKTHVDAVKKAHSANKRVLAGGLNYPQKVRHLSGDILNGKGNF